MKPIGHLDCVSSTLSGGLGINAATIPTNHFYTRMFFQPGLQALDRAIGQQVDDLMLVQIHQNSPVALPLAPSPIIDAKVPDWIAGEPLSKPSRFEGQYRR
jgi:hypothetical protein